MINGEKTCKRLKKAMNDNNKKRHYKNDYNTLYLQMKKNVSTLYLHQTPPHPHMHTSLSQQQYRLSNDQLHTQLSQPTHQHQRENEYLRTTTPNPQVEERPRDKKRRKNQSIQRTDHRAKRREGEGQRQGGMKKG